MSAIRALVRRILRLPGIPAARSVAERAVAPQVRADVHQLGLDNIAVDRRLSALERRVADLILTVAHLDHRVTELTERTGAVEAAAPALHNAMDSAHETARRLARELDDLRAARPDTGG